MTMVSNIRWGDEAQTQILCEADLGFGVTTQRLMPNDDTAVAASRLRAEILDGQHGEIGPFVAPDPAAAIDTWRATASIARGPFCLNLMAAGILPPAEAVLAAKGEWPATFAAAITGLTEAQAAAAQIDWASATTIRRNHPMIATLAAQAGLADAQVDALFGMTQAP